MLNDTNTKEYNNLEYNISDTNIPNAYVQRISGLDTVRCLMNYMIVLLHAWAAFQYVDCSTWEFYGWTFVCNHLCGMVMPTFFLVSGYLMFRDFSIASWNKKMFRRIKRLFVPYIVWNITFVIFYVSLAKVFPRLQNRVEKFGLNSFSGCISRIVSINVQPIDGPLWFLRALLILSLCSPLLWRLINYKKGVCLLLVCFIWVAGEFALGVSSILQMIIPSYSIFCYIIGGVIAVNNKDIMIMFGNIKWLIVSVVACVVHAIILIPYCVIPKNPTWILSLLAHYCILLEAPGMISLIAQLKTDTIVKNNVFIFFKELSFFTYAGHFLICSSYLHLLAPKLAWMHSFKFTVLILIFVGLGIPTIALLYWGGKRFFPKMIKLWDGSL